MIYRKSKTLIVFLIAALITTAVVTMQFAVNVNASDDIQTQNSSSVMLGDIDGDNEITEKDDKLFKNILLAKML